MKEIDQLNEYEKKGYDRMVEQVEEIPNLDPALKEIMLKLYTSPFRMSMQEQDSLVKSWVEHACGVDINNPNWAQEVGIISNVGRPQPMKNDAVAMWQQLKQQIPGLIVENDLELLIKHPWNTVMVFDLICQASFYGPKSPLIPPMMTMIHAYK